MMHTCLSCFQCFRYNKIVIHENWHLMMPLFLDFCCLALFICRDSFCNWMRCSCIYFRDTNFLFEYNMPILFLIMDNCHDYTIFCGMFWVMFSVNVFFMYVVLVTLILDKCLWAWHEKRLKSCTKQTIRCSLSPYIRLDSSCQLATFGREFCTGHSRPPPPPVANYLCGLCWESPTADCLSRWSSVQTRARAGAVHLSTPCRYCGKKLRVNRDAGTFHRRAVWGTPSMIFCGIVVG